MPVSRPILGFARFESAWVYFALGGMSWSAYVDDSIRARASAELAAPRMAVGAQASVARSDVAAGDVESGDVDVRDVDMRDVDVRGVAVRGDPAGDGAASGEAIAVAGERSTCADAAGGWVHDAWTVALGSPRELRHLPGIGEVRALELARSRWRLGAATVFSDLEALPGIGPVTARRIQAFLGGPAAARPRSTPGGSVRSGTRAPGEIHRGSGSDASLTEAAGRGNRGGRGVTRVEP